MGMGMRMNSSSNSNSHCSCSCCLLLLFVVVFCLECAQFELRKWTHKMCSEGEQGEGEYGVRSEGLR